MISVQSVSLFYSIHYMSFKIREEVATFIRDTLGKRWYISIFFILSITFSPLACYHDVIKLHPARFVEEWIKAISISILLYFLVSLIDHLRNKRTNFRSSTDLLKILLVDPTKEMHTSLSRLRELNMKLSSNENRMSIENERKILTSSYRTLRNSITFLKNNLQIYERILDASTIKYIAQWEILDNTIDQKIKAPWRQLDDNEFSDLVRPILEFLNHFEAR